MRMTEENLNKAIQIKKLLDYKRKLLEFSDSAYVDVKVYLEDSCSHERVIITDDILNDSAIKELKSQVVAGIVLRVNELHEKLEKL